MSALAFQYQRGGIHLPALGLWLDPREPRAAPERVFVSHAHSDHIAGYQEVILSLPTARLMRALLIMLAVGGLAIAAIFTGVSYRLIAPDAAILPRLCRLGKATCARSSTRPAPASSACRIRCSEWPTTWR